MTQNSANLIKRSTNHGNYTLIEPVYKLKQQAMTAGSPEDVIASIAQAEEALGVLKQEFGGWMDREVERLEAAAATYFENPGNERRAFFRAVHDIRGQAGTFGFPLAGRVADNLCRLLDAAAQIPNDIVSAHIMAIKAVVRENATTLDHPVGVLLVKSLEKVSAVILAKAARQAE